MVVGFDVMTGVVFVVVLGLYFEVDDYYRYVIHLELNYQHSNFHLL